MIRRGVIADILGIKKYESLYEEEIPESAIKVLSTKHSGRPIYTSSRSLQYSARWRKTKREYTMTRPITPDEDIEVYKKTGQAPLHPIIIYTYTRWG